MHVPQHPHPPQLRAAGDHDEVHAAALQYVRKISGSTKPSQANQAAFDRAVEEVAAAHRRLLEGLVDRRAAEEPRGRGGQGARARREALRRVAPSSEPGSFERFAESQRVSSRWIRP